MEPSAKVMSLEEITYLFHHIFLPPKLPQSDEYNAQYEILLLDRVVELLRDFSHHAEPHDAAVLTSALAMISRLRGICELDGGVNESQLKEVFSDLDFEGENHEFGASNAGILMTSIKDAIQVESFELSPLNKPAMTTIGRLQRVFPGPGLAFDRATFKEPGFQDALGHTFA
ncbi:unnamed protein product [Penicillium pancosmium]